MFGVGVLSELLFSTDVPLEMSCSSSTYPYICYVQYRPSLLTADIQYRRTLKTVDVQYRHTLIAVDVQYRSILRAVEYEVAHFSGQTPELAVLLIQENARCSRDAKPVSPRKAAETFNLSKHR
jgi:hypothetical protein